ncbi:MAG TPA: hypothetical protein VK448_00540 [Dissulfurispiraceae bacterium]|nr:hypothetical protein [Dissulfurispiraceae bacterium]
METKGSKKRKPAVKAAIFGALSLALYLLLFVYEDTINNNFARGGLFAFLPIAAAFLFSFVHGSFTGSFWSVLGVEASKKGGTH